MVIIHEWFLENMKASSYQKYLASLLPEYMANFERGYFMEGCDIYSVFEMEKTYVLKKKN